MSINDARDFLDAIQGVTGQKSTGTSGSSMGAVAPTVRLATIDPTYTSGLPKVKFDGDTAVNSKGYACANYYAPKANDRVYLIPVGNSFIIGGAIQSTNLSPITSLQYMEFASTTAFAIAGGYASFDIGPLPVDNNQTLNGAKFAKQGGFSGSIDILESGIYSVSHLTVPNGSPGATENVFRVNGGSVAATLTSGLPWETSTNITSKFTAGDNLRWGIKYTTARTAFSRVKITKLP